MHDTSIKVGDVGHVFRLEFVLFTLTTGRFDININLTFLG